MGILLLTPVFPGGERRLMVALHCSRSRTLMSKRTHQDHGRTCGPNRSGWGSSSSEKGAHRRSLRAATDKSTCGDLGYFRHARIPRNRALRKSQLVGPWLPVWDR